jgi:putative membrane protein
MNDALIRDTLALERTRLANEWTFLAYVRTALTLIAASAVLFQYFSKSPSYLLAAWLLVGAGAFTFIVGLIRFFQVARKLNGRRSVD